MPRNKEADEKFQEAVKEYLLACGYDDGLLIDWLLVTAQHIPHEDGESGTALAIFINPTQSLYRTSGLAQYAMTRTNESMRK